MANQKSNDLHAFLQSRRSIRRFHNLPIPDEIIHRIIETANYSPSAHNLQPWRFVILTKTEIKERLARAITTKFREDMLVSAIEEAEITARIQKTNRRIQEAPVIVVICQDKTQVKPQVEEYLKQRELFMGTQSVAAACVQLLLAVHAEGLGATWICWPLYTSSETSHVLGLDENWDPQAMIFIGYPKETPGPPERRPLEEVALFL